MADTGIDTSSYPKAVQPVSALQTAGEIGGLLTTQQNLQKGNLAISQAQLDQANQAYNYMGQAINALGPNPSRDQILGVGKKMVDMKLVPQTMVDAMDARIPNDPKAIPAFMNEWASATADHQAQINQTRGQPETIDTGQGIQPVSISPINGIQSTGAPIQKQLPPGTPTVNPATQQPGYIGPQPATAAPGAVAAPPAAFGYKLPIAPAPAAISPPQMPPADVSFNAPVLNKTQGRVPNNAPTPAFTPSAAPPLFEAGKTQYVDDQNTAVARQTAMQPALQALPLLKQLQMAGPGTKQYTDIVASLKNFGILPTNSSNDPTAIQQEVEKKLAQYVSGNPVGQRSDAAQELATAGSPNPNHQIKPALIQLTKDSIVLDRLAAMRSSAFTDEQGNPRQDLQNYGSFRANFPAQIDNRALGLDIMEPDERDKLINSMSTKKDDGTIVRKNTFEAQKFWNSLQQVKNLNLYNVSGQ